MITRCIFCKKPLGGNKVAKGLKACKKHQHILDTILPNREDQEEVSGVWYMDFNGDEAPVRNLEDVQTAFMQEALFVIR